MGIITNFQRNMRNATADAFNSVGEDYNINLENRDLQRISKSRMISEAKSIASSKFIDTDSGIFSDFKNFGRNLKQQLFGTPNDNRGMDSWDFDDIGFSDDGLAGRTSLSARTLNDSAMKSSEAIGGAVISGSNRQIKANSILFSNLMNEVKVGNSLLKGILDTLSDKTFRESSLKYYTESLIALKNIEVGVQHQIENTRNTEDASKPGQFAQQLASLDLKGITGTAKNVLLSAVDKQGMIKLVGGIASGMMESLMGDDGLKNMIKTGTEQLIKSKMGESFGMDMELFLSDPAMLMERLLQRGKISNSSIIRAFASRTASTVNSAFDTSQDIKDPKAKANFDIAAHTALTHVLPMKLDKIYAAITNTQLETYDYTKNKWVTVEDAASMFAKERPDVDTAIGDVMSKLKDIIKDKNIEGFTDSNGDILFEKSLAKLMNGLATKGGELKGVLNSNAKALADTYGLSIPEAIRVTELIRTLMSDKDGNDTIASADRDIINLVNDVQAYNAKMKDGYSANKLFQNGALDRVTVAQGDDVLGTLTGKGGSIGSSILSALAEVEGYGSVLKVFAVNGFNSGPSSSNGSVGRGKRNRKGITEIATPQVTLKQIETKIDSDAATEKMRKGSSVEYTNYLNDMNKVKDAENEESGTKAEKEAKALDSIRDQYNKKHKTNLSSEDIKKMMEMYEYLRATGMGGPSIMALYKEMNATGAKDWESWDNEERSRKTKPQSWEDIDLSLFTDAVKDRAANYTNKGRFTNKSFSLEDPIESSINMLKDIYKDPNMVSKIHGGAGVGIGAAIGKILQTTTGIGGVYAPIIGSLLGGAASMSDGFGGLMNQLLGESGDETVGGVKRRQRVLEKVFQQVLPSVIGGSVAGKFAGKVIGKFMPYGSILGPIGALVVGATTGGLLYQTNLLTKAMADTKFGKIMSSIPVIGKYFKVRKDENERGVNSTDASFSDLVYGNMNEERTEYDSTKADEARASYDEYNNLKKEFAEEMAEIRRERRDYNQDIDDYNTEKAEIKASKITGEELTIKLADLNRRYGRAISEYKQLDTKAEALGDKYRPLLKEAINGKIPEDRIDMMIDTAVQSGYVPGSKDQTIDGIKGLVKSGAKAVKKTFKDIDDKLMGGGLDDDEIDAKNEANKEFKDSANRTATDKAIERNAKKKAKQNKRKKDTDEESSGEGPGGNTQQHYFQGDSKWKDAKSPVINMAASGCAIMSAMSVASRILKMPINDSKYFTKLAYMYLTRSGIRSAYFEKVFSNLGASVVTYKSFNTMSTEMKTKIFEAMGKCWGAGGSVIALIDQPDIGNKHFVSFSRISTTLFSAVMHDPNVNIPQEVNLGDLAPVIHEIIIVTPTKSTVEAAYKKKVMTRDEMAEANYDVSELEDNDKTVVQKLTNSRIGKYDLGDYGKKFSNLGDDYLNWVNDDSSSPEGKIANALLYGVMGAVDTLTGSVKMITKGLSKGFKLALKSMGPLGQMISVGWKLGVGATKMMWGLSKMGAKFAIGTGKLIGKAFKKSGSRRKVVGELDTLFNTATKLRADGTIVDSTNDIVLGKLLANGDVTDADGKDVIGNIPIDDMKKSGMDKSIESGGKKTKLGLIGEQGLKGAWKTLRDRKNERLAEAALKNGEAAKKYTRGESVYEDTLDAHKAFFNDNPIRVEVEGGALDAVAATGAVDVDAAQEAIKAVGNRTSKGRNPRANREVQNKAAIIKRSLNGRTADEIDKFQDEEAEREERKIAALESNHGGKGADGSSGWGKMLPLLGALLPMMGALPGLTGMFDKLSGDVNLNQAKLMFDASKGGGRLGILGAKKIGKLIVGKADESTGLIGKILKKGRGFAGAGVSKGVDISEKILNGVDDVGPKARKYVMDIFTWLLQKGSKIIPAKYMSKMSELIVRITAILQKKVAKVLTNPKIAPAMSVTKNIPFINIAFALWDFIKGFKDAEEYLGIPEDAVTVGMRVATAFSNGFISVLAAFISSAITTGTGGTAIAVSVIINLIMGSINPGWLAKEIYNLLSIGDNLDEAAGKKLSKKTGKETKIKTSVGLTGSDKAMIHETVRSSDSEDRASESQSVMQRVSNTFKNIFAPSTMGADGTAGGVSADSSSGRTSLPTESSNAEYSSDGTHPTGNPNSRISSVFGPRKHPTKGVLSPHKGIDFAVATGTPIYAMADGKIEKAGMGGGGAGLMITLNGTDGVVYKYMHLNSLKVSAGQIVKKGQIIALSGGDKSKDGDKAGASTGPHLHFQMEKNGTAFDPVPALGLNKGNISTGKNSKENEQYLAKNAQSDSKQKTQNPGNLGIGSGVDGISKEAEAAILAIPGLLMNLISAVKSSAPAGESKGPDSPVDFNSLLNGLRGTASGGTPMI